MRYDVILDGILEETYAVTLLPFGAGLLENPAKLDHGIHFDGNGAVEAFNPRCDLRGHEPTLTVIKKTNGLIDMTPTCAPANKMRKYGVFSASTTKSIDDIVPDIHKIVRSPVNVNLQPIILDRRGAHPARICIASSNGAKSVAALLMNGLPGTTSLMIVSFDSAWQMLRQHTFSAAPRQPSANFS